MQPIAPVRSQLGRQTGHRYRLAMRLQECRVYLARMAHPAGSQNQVAAAQTFVRPEIGAVIAGRLLKTTYRALHAFPGAVTHKMPAPADQRIRLGRLETVPQSR